MAGAQPGADRQRHVRAAGLPALGHALIGCAPARGENPLAGARSKVNQTLPGCRRETNYGGSHAVGRGAARSTGFNYIQTMCLGKNGVLYATNRGNENNFGMHANKIQLGGPGEEELITDFFEYGEEEGHSVWPFGIAVDDERDRVYCSDEWKNTISVFDTGGNYITKFGATGSSDGELLRPAGLVVE